MTKNPRNISFAGGKVDLLKNVIFKEPIAPLGPVIFIHPPKTAGTNLVYINEAAEKVRDDVQALRFAVPRVEGVSPNRIEAGWIGGLKAIPEKLKEDSHIADEKTFISGHFPYGAHGDDYLKGHFDYIMTFRDPVEREISAVNFDFQREYTTTAQAEHYLWSALDNPQTRMLAGKEYMTGPCTEETWNQAQENLKKLAFAVPSEDAKSFFEVFSSLHHWGPIALSRAQVTGKKVFTEISPELRAQLEERHAYDVRLHAQVTEAWEAWKKQHIATHQPYDETLPILTILPEFATNKTPEWKTMAELVAYNETAKDLVEIQQQHSGLVEPHLLPTGTLESVTTYVGTTPSGMAEEHLEL